MVSVERSVQLSLVHYAQCHVVIASKLLKMMISKKNNCPDAISKRHIFTRTHLDVIRKAPKWAKALI